MYQVIAMRTPSPPQIIVQYASADSIRISWDAPDDGGAPLQGYTVSYKVMGDAWSQIELMPEITAYTIIGLKCGNQYIIKMSAHNMVGDGQDCEEINVWTKGKCNYSQTTLFPNYPLTNHNCFSSFFPLRTSSIPGPRWK